MAKQVEAQVEQRAGPKPEREEIWALWYWTSLGEWLHHEWYSTEEDAQTDADEIGADTCIVHFVLE